MSLTTNIAFAIGYSYDTFQNVLIPCAHGAQQFLLVWGRHYMTFVSKSKISLQ
jgi:hypothetical protein